MPTYVFKGRNRLNEMIAGERDAATQDELRALLRREQIVMTQASEKGREISIPKLGRRKKVKARELAVFTRQFSVMIDAGLPLVQCIDILGEQQQNAFFKDVLRQVRQNVEEGSTLFAALEKHPKVFDSLYTHMVEAGETGGVLDLILQRLATLIEKVVKLKRSIVSASIYPAAVVTVAIGAIAIIMVVVIPQFEQIFLGLLGPGEALPLPTRIVMAISGFLAGWGGLGLLVTIIASATGTRFYYKTPKGRWNLDKLLLKTPIFGSILRKVAVARFSRILSTLLSSGVPILQSLDI
ncbi:MAG: type II secretion system F family protein, partial [Pyrinomonadaceae bacterium]